MKKITGFSVNYPTTILMLVFAVLLLGYISFSKLGIDLFPDLNNPRIFIEIKAGERPPEEIEKQFVERIESLSIRQKNVQEVSSVIQLGSAQITVEYLWDMDMDEAFLDIQKTLTSFSQNEDIDELTISHLDPNAVPVVIIGLSHMTIDDLDELRKTAENYIRNEFIRLEGVADVELSGQLEKEVSIETDRYLLDAHQLTPDIVANQINAYNRNVSGGSIVEMGLRYIIKGVSTFGSIEDIENIIVSYKELNNESQEKTPVYLKDVAVVKFANKDPENIVRINGKRCIGLSVYKETTYNTVRAVQELLDALGTVKKALPGYQFTIIHNQADFINQSIDEVKETALIGICLAMIILYIFLRRLGATLIISIAIPISIVATFNLMYFNGLTLNIMTLGGLALGAGMLVDNAIVVMENIFRHLESGASLKEASVQGAAQVGGAITASTLTTLVVFLPIVYLHGASSELFKDQAWTVAFSLFSSLLVAILVIPMLSSRLLKIKATKLQRSINFPWYASLLNNILDRRWFVVLLAAILVFVSILMIPLVGSEFIPKSDSNEFIVQLKLPPGTELLRTEKVVDDIEKMVQSVINDELETTYSQIGQIGSLTTDETSVFEDENTASVNILLKQKRHRSTDQIITQLNTTLANIPDVEIQFVQEQTALQTSMGTEEAPIVVEVKGEELEQIELLTEQIKQKMLPINELFNIETSFEKGAPEIEVVIDRLQAGLYNIGVTNISNQLRDELLGKDVGEWDTQGELVDLTLHLPKVSLHQFEDIMIENAGQQIPLSEIAQIKMTTAPREIYRRNQNRIGKVTAHYKKGMPFDQIVHNIEAELNHIDFPQKYQAQITGEEEKRKESFQNLSFALLLSIILVYMVLASQFESLIHPLTILLTIPLAGVGAIWIFFLLGKTLNIMAYIGIIMLVGIAVNDSIILVDAINQIKKEGLTRREAIIQAGQMRIRPIFMTSLTTILALFPLTLGFGEGAALRSPMALAVIGGLVTSTLLTLAVIPCVYFLLDQLKDNLRVGR